MRELLFPLLFPALGGSGATPQPGSAVTLGCTSGSLPTLHILPALVFSCPALSWDKNPLAVPGARLWRVLAQLLSSHSSGEGAGLGLRQGANLFLLLLWCHGMVKGLINLLWLLLHHPGTSEPHCPLWGVQKGCRAQGKCPWQDPAEAPCPLWASSFPSRAGRSCAVILAFPWHG